MSRRHVEAAVWDVAAELVGPLGLELVAVEYVKERDDYHLRVYIDKPAGVGLDDCERMSKRLSDRLDEVDPIPGSYLLEVSSPGIDRPLRTPADYDRFRGQTVRIRTFAPIDGRKNWRGAIVGRDDDHVELDVDGGRVALPFRMIARANLAP